MWTSSCTDLTAEMKWNWLYNQSVLLIVIPQSSGKNCSVDTVSVRLSQKSSILWNTRTVVLLKASSLSDLYSGSLILHKQRCQSQLLMWNSRQMCPQNRKCFNIWKIEEKKGPCRLGCLEGYVNRIKMYLFMLHFFFHRKNLTRYLHNSSVVLLLSLPCEYLRDYSVILFV